MHPPRSHTTPREASQGKSSAGETRALSQRILVFPKDYASPSPALMVCSSSGCTPRKSCTQRKTETHFAKRRQTPKTTQEGNASQHVFLQFNQNTDRQTLYHINMFLSQGGKTMPSPFYRSWLSFLFDLLGTSAQQFLPKCITCPQPAARRRALWWPVPNLLSASPPQGDTRLPRGHPAGSVPVWGFIRDRHLEE